MSELTIRMTNDDDQVSKANQIDMLEELHKFFYGHNLYLASFFRPELVDWATCAIENDLAPDIWADRMYHMEQMKDAEAKVHNLRAANETLEAEIKARDENIDDVFIAKDERIKGLEGQLELIEHINDSHRGDLRMARTRIIELSDQTRQQEQLINELKARLWDYHIEELHDGCA